MAKTLQDPNLPAGAIVEEREDGSALRNDGVELGAANKNRWYVLATIFGEQKEGAEQFNRDLAKKNRRAWNSWACAGLSEKKLEKLAEEMGLNSRYEVARLDVKETEEITKRFKARLRTNAELPKRT